jgi:glycogen(starch) synthase
VKILLHTPFYPHIGGIETVAWLLVHEWHGLGESVKVASDVRYDPARHRDFPFSVYYRPGTIQLVRLVEWADVFVHMNISLKAYWPRLIVRRPFVAVNHAYYYSDSEGNRRWPERLKLYLTKSAVNIAVSKSVAERIPATCTVIPNPVDLSKFQQNDHEPRNKDLVFLGRLVSDKGCDLLIEALAQLKLRGIRPSLTIIGDGPERMVLERLVIALNLSGQIVFADAPTSEEVSKLLHSHKIMVVPSRYEESFGIVALEGAACGCIVLGSDGGGLAEAIGPAGSTFRRGDIGDLTSKLCVLLQTPVDRDEKAIAAHLALHHPARVAKSYLDVFNNAVGV